MRDHLNQLNQLNELTGKVAIVTGAGGGIGRRIALAFVEAGASVMVVDVNAAGCLETVAQIGARYGTERSAHTVADIADASGIKGIVDQTVEVFGKLNCIVNNAAIGGGGMLDEMTIEAYDRVMAINLRAPLFFAQAGSKYLAQHPGSSIVNISSVRGSISMPGGLAYDTSKAGLLGLTRTLAVEMGLAGIRVNAICPGHIMSNGEEVWRAHVPANIQRLMPFPYPLGRVGYPEEIANATVFLASDAASFITGQALTVDGGLTIMNPETALFRAEATLNGAE